MTGRYTGTHGDAGWTACWACKRPHDEHTGDELRCPVTDAKLDPAVCRRLAAQLLECRLAGDVMQWIDRQYLPADDEVLADRIVREIRDGIDGGRCDPLEIFEGETAPAIAAQLTAAAECQEHAEHWKQVAIRLDDEKHQAQDEVTRCSAIALENARKQDAAQLERDALRARLAETSKLLETECSLSMNTTNAMLKAQAERDVLRAMLCDLLASAHPHPVEHPTMAAQWARARELIKGGPPATPCQVLDPAADLTSEQLDGMDLWDRDVMLDERHRAAGAMLVRRAIAEIRRHRAADARRCTCGKSPMSGHQPWCEALRGQLGFQPRAARVAEVNPDE